VRSFTRCSWACSAEFHNVTKPAFLDQLLEMRPFVTGADDVHRERRVVGEALPKALGNVK